MNTARHMLKDGTIANLSASEGMVNLHELVKVLDNSCWLLMDRVKEITNKVINHDISEPYMQQIQADHLINLSQKLLKALKARHAIRVIAETDREFIAIKEGKHD